MYLIISIILSCVLGFLLIMLGPLYGGIIAFGIFTGSMLRGLYLLSDFQKKLLKDDPKRDRVREAYENYLKERDNKI